MTFPPAQKRLGQHFLIDPNIVRKILSLAALHPDETVLEIGPGRGILTRALCQQARHVIAVELDARLRDPLEQELADCRSLELRFGDALKFPYETLPVGAVVVANLPYYLSTPLLFRLLAVRERLARMVLMLQREVADRLVAPPGSRDYGIVSVLVSYYAEVAIGFHVSSSCFRPRPDVDSTVVTLRPRLQQVVRVDDEAAFMKTVRAAFAHRRKTVSNSLRDEGLAVDMIVQGLAAARLDPSRRAETLTLAEFAALANALAAKKAFEVPS
jgi:16S rRNA (adenine1518-N6/adenine1519-N6)-dimethyltransferase